MYKCIKIEEKCKIKGKAEGGRSSATSAGRIADEVCPLTSTAILKRPLADAACSWTRKAEGACSTIPRGGFLMYKRILGFVLVIFLVGCSENNSQQRFDDSNPTPQKTSVRDSHINIDNENNISDEQRAKHLANIAASVPNVNNASAVVVGNMAIVGINIDGDVDRGKVGTIKYSVTESIRNDPQGAGVIVVADPDINARLDEINEEMNEGKPIQGIMNELADIIGRIIPDAPADENQENPEDSVDKQNQNTDQQEIRQQQEEHSGNRRKS